MMATLNIQVSSNSWQCRAPKNHRNEFQTVASHMLVNIEACGGKEKEGMEEKKEEDKIGLRKKRKKEKKKWGTLETRKSEEKLEEDLGMSEQVSRTDASWWVGGEKTREGQVDRWAGGEGKEQKMMEGR